MTIIIVPGTPGHSIEWERRQMLGARASAGQPYWTDYSFIEVSTWSHGWPFEYLRRPWRGSDALIDNDGIPVLWTMPSAWPSSDKFYEFSLLKLLADILIGAAIVAFALTACETWRRRRGAFRVRLLDAGVFVTFACLILGWRQFQVHTRAREQATITLMKARGSLGELSRALPSIRAVSNYHGPDWLQRLVGNSHYLPFCFRVDCLDLDLRLLSADDYQDIRKFPHVRTVRCVGRLTHEFVEVLDSLPKLRSLDGELESYSGRPPKPMLASAEFELLGNLPRLTTLKLGHSPLLPDDLDMLARMPRLETLQISGSDLLVEDLSRLSALPALKTVFLRITATNEELQAFQDGQIHYRLVWDETRNLDPWKVVQFRIARWRGHTHLSDSRPGIRHELDLSGTLLTRVRLKQLPPILSEVDGLTLGDVDSTETAMQLICRCGRLQYLDARHVPLARQDLDNILTEEIEELFLRQGPLTVQDYCELNEKLRPNIPNNHSSLTIFASTFSTKEAKQIQDALPDIFVEVYQGMVANKDELIDPYPESTFDPLFQ